MSDLSSGFPAEYMGLLRSNFSVIGNGPLAEEF